MDSRAKAEQLRNIVRSGSAERFRRQENRLAFETFLLALFPSHILGTVLDKFGIRNCCI